MIDINYIDLLKKASDCARSDIDLMYPDDKEHEDLRSSKYVSLTRKYFLQYTQPSRYRGLR